MFSKRAQVKQRRERKQHCRGCSRHRRREKYFTCLPPSFIYLCLKRMCFVWGKLLRSTKYGSKTLERLNLLKLIARLMLEPQSEFRF